MDNKITYRRVGNFYLPNLAFPKTKYSNYKLGKYGRMRARYLKEHKKAEYTILLIDGKLDEHLYNTDIECKKRFELLMKQYVEKENITEELKAIGKVFNNIAMQFNSLNCINVDYYGMACDRLENVMDKTRVVFFEKRFYVNYTN